MVAASRIGYLPALSRPIEAVKPPVGKSPVSPSVSGVALAYLKEAGGAKNLVFKPLAIGAEWVQFFSPNDQAAALMATAKDGKNIAEIASLPEKVVGVGEKVAAFVANPSFSAIGRIVQSFCELTVPFTDGVKVITAKVYPLSARAMTIISTSASAALVTAMTFGAYDEIAKVGSADALAAKVVKGKQDPKAQLFATAQRVNSAFTLMRNASYFSLGALSLGATFLPGVVVLGWNMTALATSGLFFTLLSHFHKKMGLEPVTP